MRNVFWLCTVGATVRGWTCESQLILVIAVIQRSMVGLGRVDVRIASMVAVLY